MPALNTEDYYIKMKPNLIGSIEKNLDYYQKYLVRHITRPKIDQIFSEARTKFEELLPQLPYIGNETNPLANGFVASAWSLGFFQALEGEGMSLREIAEMMYQKMEFDAESRSPEKKRRIKDFYFSPEMRKVEIERSKASLSKKYPQDWISEYVEGDGQEFDFGINFSECAICKLFEQHDAIRYVPIFCLSDYATYRANDIGFKRPQNLVLGGSVCEFRFKKDWKTPSGWPPEDLDESIVF